MLFAKRIALVTGAGSGIGKASALALAREGATVILMGRTASELEATAREIAARGGGTARPMIADISDEEAMATAFAVLADEFGHLDCVFANAGINGTWAPLDELRYADWQKTMSVNLGGTFLTLHHAIPLMKARGGVILITASINGNRTFTTAGATAYATTKAGEVALAQMAALELAQYRIRVNVICPGAIESEIEDNTKRVDVEAAEVPAEYPEGDVPLTHGAPGEAEDVAELVVFLASDRAKHITGTPIYVDGA